jgi:hypothetical protein
LVVVSDEPVTSFRFVEPDERECILRQPIIATELSVQLFVIPSIGGGLQPLGDHTVIVTPASGPDWSAKTDTTGYVRIPKLPPGSYRLQVPYVMEPLSQDVTIVRSGQRRTIAAIANVTCGKVCLVPFQSQPGSSAPPCLFNP